MLCVLGIGEVAEWLNAPVSKTGMGASPSGVRIPPSPPALSTLGAAVPGRIITSKHRLNRKLGQEWCPEENHERFEPVNILKRIGTKLPHEEGKPRWADGLIRHLEMLVSMTQERDWHDGRPIVWMSVQETADRLGISSAQVNEHENALTAGNALTNRNRFKSAYAFEELIAEFGAAFLCQQIGLTSTLREDHVIYIADWVKALKSDPKVLFKAASAAEKAANYLLSMCDAEKAA